MKHLSETETNKLLFAKIKSNNPFTYVRFGDGDLLIMSDPNFNKESFHKQSPILRKELIESFLIRDSNYLIGNVGGVGNFNYDDRLKSISQTLINDDYTYLSAISIHRLYMDHHIKPNFLDLCKLFNDKEVLFIGGQSLNKPIIKTAFNIKTFISLPDSNAYYSLGDKMKEIKNQCSIHSTLICAIGLATRVLAKRLFMDGIKNIQFIDIGSVVDALIQSPTRSWIKTHTEQTQLYIKEINELRDL